MKPADQYQLYYFNACPYCIFVRLVIWWRGHNIPLKNIFLPSENNSDLMAGGGKSQVPCLRIENANGDIHWMYESVDIVRHLKSSLGS